MINDWTAVAPGGNHVCALKGAGQVWCWGAAENGQNRLAAPSDKLGDCWYDPCDDTTVPAPAAWTRGPVVDAATLAECQTQCGPKLSADLQCVKTRCGEELSRCIGQAQQACAAAMQGPCRGQYVAASCVDWRERIGKHLAYENCVEADQACSTQAQRACAPDN